MTAAPTDSHWPPWTAEPDRLAPGSGAPAVASALAWLEALGERHGWPPKALFALTLCADEALANVASTPGGPTARARWLACGGPGGLALYIEDDGEAFDPTAQASPQRPCRWTRRKSAATACALMRHYLHHLLYRREGLRNVLLLELAT